MESIRSRPETQPAPLPSWLWTTKSETARRLRGRIESVIDWATARGYRQGENPARWKGHLDQLLPVRSKVAKVERHAALPYSEIGDFFATLNEHRAPLCDRAIKILDELHQVRQGDFIFPGRRESSSLSNMAMLQLLKRMGRPDLTVHGFRSTFRDWAAEQTN